MDKADEYIMDLTSRVVYLQQMSQDQRLLIDALIIVLELMAHNQVQDCQETAKKTLIALGRWERD